MKFLFNKKYRNEQANRPSHIGIIMDGNGRWAQHQGLPRQLGHNAGAKVFRKIAKHCSNIGIKYLTVFAFSTENWRREKDEIKYLMTLFKRYLEEALSDFKDENIKINFLGEKDIFSSDIRALIDKVENASKDNNGMVLNIAMNYGGRREIVTAAKNIAKKIAEKEILLSDVSEETFSNFLYTSGQPDVDLVIRTSGEFRVSNFLVWQAAYAEYFIEDKFWPDFQTDDFDRILKLYSKRNRRFGGV